MKQRQTRETRNQLFKEFDPFPYQLGAKRSHPRYVTAGVRETGDDEKRCAHRRHNHWNRSGCVFSRLNGRCPPRYDQIDLETSKLGSHVRKSLGVTFRRPVFDDQVLSFDVAEFPQPVAQRVEIGGVLCRRYRFQNPDSIDLPPLLRVRYERPCGRATEKRDKLPPLHSITSSARASSVVGTVRPSALAVLRLITSSYFVGACTGRSAGFSPLRIRST